MDEKLIKDITNMTNKRIHKTFRMLEHPIQEWMVKEILKSILEKWTGIKED